MNAKSGASLPLLQTMQVTGRTVGYRRAGRGAPVLLLHGGMSNSAEWRHQLAGLATELDLVAWDAPGSGGSDDPDEHWSLEDFAACAWDLMTALGPDEVHLAGLSFGGGLALAMYAHAPDRVRSLTLMSAYAGWKGSLPPDEVAARLGFCLAAAADAPAVPDPEGARPFVGASPSAELLEEVAALEVGTTAAGYRVQGSAFAEADLRAVLPSVSVPTVVLHGDQDRRCPRAVAEALHAGLPGSRFVVLPGVGHCLNLEAPEETNRLLLEHVRAAEEHRRSR